MAHPDPKVIQAKRQMAHPVRRKPLAASSGGLVSLLPNTSDPGIYGAAARFVARLTPRAGRRRGLVVVLAVLVVAAVLAASLPGGWIDPASASPSPDPAANVVPVDPTVSRGPSTAVTSTAVTSTAVTSPDPTPDATPSATATASATPIVGPTVNPTPAPPTKLVVPISWPWATR
jgi:hypothetical protein